MILIDPKVKAESDSFSATQQRVKEYIKSHSSLQQNVAVVDLRDVTDMTILHSSFKFLHYAIVPEATVAMRIYHPNLDPTKVRFQVGRSFIHPHPSQVDIAEVLKPLGGGGHSAAGGCTVATELFQETFDTIITQLYS